MSEQKYPEKVCFSVNKPTAERIKALPRTINVSEIMRNKLIEALNDIDMIKPIKEMQKEATS